MIVLFFVGAPGVGKTTLVRKYIEPDSISIAKPKWTVGQCHVAAGHFTGGTFDGADTVPYNGVKDALAFWEQRLYEHALTIFDGDRFSHAGALDFFQERKVRVGCIHLSAPDAVLQDRREARGSKQNPTWMKGRVSKAANFAKLCEARGLTTLYLGSELSAMKVETMIADVFGVSRAV